MSWKVKNNQQKEVRAESQFMWTVISDLSAKRIYKPDL